MGGGFQAGYSIQTEDGYPQMTASVIAGENGQGNAALAPMMEHAEKYAYIGKGYDNLTVTPIPDVMTSQKVTITYDGPSAGCSVTEVDRGTHESSECSGRGNCDYSTGTCLCDAGYTLEACSEQTVLVYMEADTTICMKERRRAMNTSCLAMRQARISFKWQCAFPTKPNKYIKGSTIQN